MHHLDKNRWGELPSPKVTPVTPSSPENQSLQTETSPEPACFLGRLGSHEVLWLAPWWLPLCFQRWCENCGCCETRNSYIWTEGTDLWVSVMGCCRDVQIWNHMKPKSHPSGLQMSPGWTQVKPKLFPTISYKTLLFIVLWTLQGFKRKNWNRNNSRYITLCKGPWLIQLHCKHDIL